MRPVPPRVLPACDLDAATVSTALAGLLPGFTHGTCRIAVPGGPVVIPWSCRGSGPPLLLLHGHPQSRAIWAGVACHLAERYTVVLSDLRGYGDAGKPLPIAGEPAHTAASKRSMALDQVTMMDALGHASFGLVGHDRGARVAHRLALDHPQAVSRLMLLDIAPTLDMFEQADTALAMAYWHWFFLAQPAPLPETLIGANPVFYLEQLMGNRSAGLAPFVPAAWAEYTRFASDPATVHAMCEDYRAAATIDLDHDRKSRADGLRIECPVRVLWGARGVIGRLFEPLALWRAATGPGWPVDGHALSCGHYIPEEVPAGLLAQITDFIPDKSPTNEEQA